MLFLRMYSTLERNTRMQKTCAFKQAFTVQKVKKNIEILILTNL